ncbi:hypothetical protein V5799_023094 [Amblyomma americanum]|uniref:Uncharacterized protein n=2 Tax=Amblyomma americanum TaxID=6943 RepID=A0AAQ4FIZ2_AMBAM
MAAQEGNGNVLVPEDACPAGPKEEPPAEDGKMSTTDHGPTSTPCPLQQGPLEGLVPVQQCYVMLPPSRHQLLPDDTALPTDPLPVWSDGVSARGLHICPSRYIIDELVGMPTKAE